MCPYIFIYFKPMLVSESDQQLTKVCPGGMSETPGPVSHIPNMSQEGPHKGTYS